MKLCPRCNLHVCNHKTALYKFGLLKLIVAQKSLTAVTDFLDRMVIFLPSTPDIHSKLSDTIDGLKKSSEKILDFREWMETQIEINGE